MFCIHSALSCAMVLRLKTWHNSSVFRSMFVHMFVHVNKLKMIIIYNVG